jgi:hypothetical protein
MQATSLNNISPFMIAVAGQSQSTQRALVAIEAPQTLEHCRIVFLPCVDVLRPVGRSGWVAASGSRHVDRSGWVAAGGSQRVGRSEWVAAGGSQRLNQMCFSAVVSQSLQEARNHADT